MYGSSLHGLLHWYTSEWRDSIECFGKVPWGLRHVSSLIRKFISISYKWIAVSVTIAILHIKSEGKKSEKKITFVINCKMWQCEWMYRFKLSLTERTGIINGKLQISLLCRMLKKRTWKQPTQEEFNSTSLFCDSFFIVFESELVREKYFSSRGCWMLAVPDYSNQLGW